MLLELLTSLTDITQTTFHKYVEVHEGSSGLEENCSVWLVIKTIIIIIIIIGIGPSV
jgi:hypothetical protein